MKRGLILSISKKMNGRSCIKQNNYLMIIKADRMSGSKVVITEIIFV